MKRVAAIAGREAASGKGAGGSAAPVAAIVPASATGATDERVVTVIQSAMNPLVEEIGRLREELGRERALREGAERERDELRERLGRRRGWRRLFGGDA